MYATAPANAAAILDSDFIALVVVKDRHIVWANTAMHRIFGYAPDELIGKPTRQLFPDQAGYDAFGREVSAALERNAIHRTLIPQRRKDGSTGWFEFNISRHANQADLAVAAIVDRTQSHELLVQLQAAEQRYRSVVEDQTEVICRLRPDGTFVFVNDVYCRVFGKPARELIGQVWHPLAHPDDLPLIEARLRQMAPENPVVTIENRVFVAGGELRWMQFVNRGLYDADGHLMEIQCVGRDITDLKHATLALQESEAALERAQAVARIGSFTMRSDTEHFLYSKETARLFDLEEQQEIRFEQWFSRVHPDDQAAVEAAWRAALQGAPYDMTYRIVVRGEILWIRALAELTFDEAGRFIAAVGTVQDITAQKHAEIALRESEERLSLALAGSGLGYWDTDISTGTVKVDERVSAILGYSSEELGEQAFWRSLHDPRERERFERDLTAHLQGDTATFSNEHRLRHKDGHWVSVEARGKIIERDADGSPLRMVGTLLDVTQRKRLNQEGVELLKQIEALIRESAADTSSRRADRKAVESLTKRESQVLAMIADGMTSAQIGMQLHLATNTVNVHRQKLMKKLGLHSTAEVTRFAVDHGLMQKP